MKTLVRAWDFVVWGWRRSGCLLFGHDERTVPAYSTETEKFVRCQNCRSTRWIDE